MRWSYGAGIAMKLGGVARIELNYVKPVAQPGDSVDKNFQFGIGVNFLWWSQRVVILLKLLCDCL